MPRTSWLYEKQQKQIDTMCLTLFAKMHLAICVGFGQLRRQFVSVNAFEEVLP
jgi:hypothetical protein